MQGARTSALGASLVGRVWNVTVGKKVLMAASGVVLIGYVTGHLIGNWQIFIGPEQLNAYATTLHSLGPLLWAVRAFLLAWFILHIVDGVRLWLENRRARPQRYVREDTVQATLASRTMIWSGLALFAFVVYHVMHFTMHVTNPEYTEFVHGEHFDVFTMVVTGFRNPLISAVYIVAMAFVALHLSHALASMFQTFGWNKDSANARLERVSLVFAWAVFIGYIAIPISVLIGLVGGDVR
jgi:succinate dehydrogenase / fumarate reductase cytochrome b subunit